MKKRTLLVAILALVLVSSICVTPILAGGGCGCGGSGCMCNKGESDMSDQISEKAMMLIANDDELGLTEDQLKKIKDLKHKTKKDMIMKDAEIDVVAVDAKALLWDDPIDIVAVNKLIDSKYDLKKAKAKAFVAALADLTKEQKDKLKAIMKDQKKMMMGCPMMQGKGHAMMEKSMKPEAKK
jgi:Spy/CpxP family protein refolding chaperone